jgi:antitoxin component YwqK of YwqJK toxin-antitoxin module
MRRFLLLLLLFASYNVCIGQQILVEKHDDGTYSKGVRDENGYKVGKWEKFYASGKLFIEANYINDTLNGDVTSFYKNGKTQAENVYIAGKLNGISKQYDIKGNPIREISSKENLIFGNCKYYENGVIDNERYYKNGIIDGPCKQYRKGKLYMEWTELQNGARKNQICYDLKTGKKKDCGFL